MNLEPLSWEDLINYNKKTKFKNREIIVIDINDEIGKKYNAIVIKHDNNKNVHIRYLDNPFYEEKYWWTGNKDNIPGLNPLSYSATFLGDSHNDMEYLKKSDFVENGYDDIINYEKEPHRFFKSTMNYPYLDGIQGNVHVNYYYVSMFNKDLFDDIIPECIKNKIKSENDITWIKTKKYTNDNNDMILYNILECLPLNYSQIVKEYNSRKKRGKIKNVLINFKTFLSLLITNSFIKNYSEYIDLNEDDIKNIKQLLKDGKNNINLIKILPYLLNYNIKIFDCTNNDLNIIKYKCTNKDNYIYMIKFLDNLDVLKCC